MPVTKGSKDKRGGILRLKCNQCGAVFVRDAREKTFKTFMTKRGYKSYCEKTGKSVLCRPASKVERVNSEGAVMSWRYQPVSVVENGNVNYWLCEVYLDEHGKLDKWTTPPGICPSGETHINELTQDLCHMLIDAYCWEPVKYDELKSGMTFRRKATAKQREALARMVENMAQNLKATTE